MSRITWKKKEKGKPKLKLVTKEYDLIAMGRSSIDLYAAQVGAPFSKIKSFHAYVGGCPTNVAVGAARLGLKVALLTAVGKDPVGDFILHFLKKEKVETRFIPYKKEHRTSAVLLGIQPPDKFPLVFYREKCADRELNKKDVSKAPLTKCRYLFLAGTNLSHQPARSATLFAAKKAFASGAKVILDLDLRLDQWKSPLAYRQNILRLLPHCHIVIGTEEELKALTLKNPARASIKENQVTNPKVKGSLRIARHLLLHAGIEALVIKKGARGSEAFFPSAPPLFSPPFPVKVLNVLGAGDAFAAGLIYALCQEKSWAEALAFANACGAILVTRPGCSNFMPRKKEVANFLKRFCP